MNKMQDAERNDFNCEVIWNDVHKRNWQISIKWTLESL